MYFEYGNKEIEFLKKRDKLLGEAIERIGHINRPVDSDVFSSIVHHIIGQQISTVALATIWQRLIDKTGQVNSETICSLELDELQKLGMTFRKAGYIKDFADKVRNEEFDINSINELTNEEIIKKL